ncbi:MAG TPA: response regulator transcription factor [Candidatus Dormibacteraeota bacterium]
MTPIRILLVDDHEMVREGLKAMLQSESDLEVVAETGLGREVPALLEQTQPDVVLLDVRLPDMSGVEVCRQAVRSDPNLKVIMLTTFVDPDLVDECIEAGARGYLVKDVRGMSLKENVRAVSRGQAVLAPEVAGPILDRVRDRRSAEATRAPALTQSQVAILGLMTRGFSNREIAAEVHLSENTIKTHVQEIFRKLDVHNRVEAVMTATKNNWL